MDLKSILGYSQGSPFANNPYLNIQGNNITMQNTDIPLLLQPMKKGKKFGKPKMGIPFDKNPYLFPSADSVMEIPLMQKGGISYEDWKKKYNLKESNDYRLQRAWELGYVPDNQGHLPSVDNQTLEFLKAPNHPSIKSELEWYNSPEAQGFKSKYDIDSTGLFWKYVPKMQSGGKGGFSWMQPIPRPSSESTSMGVDVLRRNPELERKVANQRAIQESLEKQGQIKQAEPKRSAKSKAWAIATHPMTALKYKLHGQDIPENFERGEVNPLEHAVNIVNPFAYGDIAASIPGNIRRGEYLQAGLNTASILPFAAEFRPQLKNITKTLIDIPRAESLKEAMGRVAGIPLKKDLPRMAAEDVKALRQVQEIGRLRATNVSMAEQMKYGLESNLPEEHFQQVFRKSRQEAQDLLNEGFGQQKAARFADIRGRINLQRPSRGRDLDIDVTGITDERFQRAYNDLISSGRVSRTIIPGQESSRIPLSMQLKQDINLGVNKLSNKLEDFVGNVAQNYPFYSGEVLEKVPSLSLSGSGNLFATNYHRLHRMQKEVSKKVSFAPEGIKSGDVFTGSTNTSHSSYLPQLKQVFKYTKGDPQFLGYRPMNTLGFLSGYGYEGKDIAKYLNSEIDEQIKRGILPKNIQRPFVKGEYVILPHYGVKQHKKGGVIKAQNGIEGTMGGYTDIPFKYNSAWGGQFQMGGSLPGSVGFTYARTQGIPSEGPYAKKTMPSAQNGKVHKKYLPEKVENWQEPKYVAGLNSEGHYGYDGKGTINYDPNSQIENINNPWWVEHEKYHHFQTLSGRNPKERRQQEVDNQVNEMIKSNPGLQFIPKSKLISGSKPNEKGQKSFVGAEDLIYENPSTLEGEARLYEDYINSGGKSIFPKQENGGMSYYQHGLDWKPKSISKKGSKVPKAQVGIKYVMPRAASESTAIMFFDPVTKRMVSTATTGQKKEDVKASTEAMGKAKRREEQEKKQRIAERKAAKAFNEGKSKTFTFPTGETKSLDQMDWREKAYVSGKSVEGKGRFNENDEAWYDDWLNPFGIIGNMSGALGTAPYEAKQSDSNLPYIGAVASPLLMGRMAGSGKINPLSKKFWTNEVSNREFISNLGFGPVGMIGGISKVPGKIAQSMESGLLSNIPGPKTITLSKMLNNSKLNKTLADNLYANRILEEELIAPNISYRGTPNFPEGKIINHYGAPFLQKDGRMYYMAEFENGFGLNDATYDFMPRPDYKYPSKHIKNLQKKYNVSDAAESEFNSISTPYDNYYPFDQTVTPVDDWIIHNDFGQIKGDKTWWKKSSPYKGTTARTLFDKPVGRHLFTKQSSLESFLKKPLDQHRELIGDVINKGNVPREGITITPNVEKSLEDIEGLKSFTYNPITKSMERGIYDPLVRSRIRTNPEVIQNWLETFKKVTKQKQGGVVKDNMGYWNPENWGKVVEINSPDITMQGVNQPLLGISDEGDIQYMEPGKDYKFKGKKVTEYPIAQQGGRAPITVTDKNDPRLRAYNDSLALYNSIKKYSLDTKKPITAYSQDDANYLKLLYPNNKVTTVENIKLDPYTKSTFEEYGRKTNFVVGKNYSQKELNLESNKAEQYRNKVAITPFTHNRGNMITDDKGVALRNTKIAPIGSGYGDMSDKDNWNSGLVTLYKKPVQPYIFQEQPGLQKRVGKVNPITTPDNMYGFPDRLQGVGTQKLPPVPQGNYMVGYFDESNQGVDRGFPTKEAADDFIKILNQRNLNSVAPYRGSITQYTKLQDGGQIDDNDEFFNFLFSDEEVEQEQEDDMQVGSIWNQVDTVAQSRDEKTDAKRQREYYIQSYNASQFGGGENKAQYAYNFFKSRGLASHQAAGVVNNLIQESGNFRDDVISFETTGDNNLKDKAYGVAQWKGERKNNFLKFASSNGLNPYSLDTQLMFVEIEAKQRGDWDKLLNTKDIPEATHVFNYNYEVSADSRNPATRYLRLKHTNKYNIWE